MKLNRPQAQIYIPDGSSAGPALARTTHLAVAAHQDDIEIMAVDGILECYQHPDRWFSGAVLTDGRGSPRSGTYANYSDDEMMTVRVQEQKRAAELGGYSAIVFCDHPSADVKSGSRSVVEDIRSIILASTPQIVYTHNLADKHPTHVAVAARVIEALRQVPEDCRPQKVYGCEVWRDLGWMLDEDKVVFDCSARQDLQKELLAVFDSQIAGGKRYDLATMGRRVANATYFASHETDESSGLAYAMDLTPLIHDTSLDLRAYIAGFIHRFASDVDQMITAAFGPQPAKEEVTEQRN